MDTRPAISEVHELLLELYTIESVALPVMRDVGEVCHLPDNMATTH